jgi:hypothetical protein
LVFRYGIENLIDIVDANAWWKFRRENVCGFVLVGVVPNLQGLRHFDIDNWHLGDAGTGIVGSRSNYYGFGLESKSKSCIHEFVQELGIHSSSLE